ncbi:unnamed protein product [Arctia plantaginis]|uniref:Uncharacterized protein n=1 Tax=Arctia plantaginis TaxID=874455 RepID=A0A8S1A6Y4_ARCPL|nr:unnamed protein product [Arctia plantaginis]
MQKPFKRTKTRPIDGTWSGDVDVGVCMSETKHNRKSRVRTRHRDTGGRWRERVDTRVDVNKPQAGASTALTISGIFESVEVRCGHSGPVVKSGDVVSENSTGTRSHKMVQSTHTVHWNTIRPVLHYDRAPRQCSLRHRIPLPTGNPRRERATTSRCSVHRPASRAVPR